jgi:hypothetical protein
MEKTYSAAKRLLRGETKIYPDLGAHRALMQKSERGLTAKSNKRMEIYSPSFEAFAN